MCVQAPEGVDDVDKENMNDPIQAAMYAFNIFQYYKEREVRTLQPTYTMNTRPLLYCCLFKK